MKIDPNQPAHYQMTNDGDHRYNWPVRAEIASRVIAGFAVETRGLCVAEYAAIRAVSWADALIAELNK